MTQQKIKIPKNILLKDQGLSEWSILTAYRGSIAHNMYLPSTTPNSIDDIDIMAVCIPSKDYYYGLKQYGSRGTKEIKQNEWDIVVYELKKFISLLAKGNPNVLSLLWVDEKHVIHQTEEGKLLRKNKDLFIGKHIYFSFSGYAKDQLYKMEHLAFQGYMGEKRKQLVEKFGFDTKNAAHLIRLLRMSVEFLKDGNLIISRPDAEELISIKKGKWTLDQIKKEAESLFEKAKEAYEKSPLPSEPNHEAVNELCVTLCSMKLG